MFLDRVQWQKADDKYKTSRNTLCLPDCCEYHVRLTINAALENIVLCITRLLGFKQQ